MLLGLLLLEAAENGGEGELVAGPVAALTGGDEITMRMAKTCQPANGVVVMTGKLGLVTLSPKYQLV